MDNTTLREMDDAERMNKSQCHDESNKQEIKYIYEGFIITVELCRLWIDNTIYIKFSHYVYLSSIFVGSKETITSMNIRRK